MGVWHTRWGVVSSVIYGMHCLELPPAFVVVLPGPLPRLFFPHRAKKILHTGVLTGLNYFFSLSVCLPVCLSVCLHVRVCLFRGPRVHDVLSPYSSLFLSVPAFSLAQLPCYLYMYVSPPSLLRRARDLSDERAQRAWFPYPLFLARSAYGREHISAHRAMFEDLPLHSSL